MSGSFKTKKVFLKASAPGGSGQKYGSEAGPVQINKGKIVGGRWKILKKLGEGGCGAVYKVEDLKTKGPNNMAALKAESNFVAGGTVLKLEVQVRCASSFIYRNPVLFWILRRLAGRPHVAQLLHSGKKELYCYMVMSLLGDDLGTLTKKNKRVSSISTQIRVGLNILYGVKLVHDVGFVHRDLKPSNIAIGLKGSSDAHFLHVLDFGLSREYIVMENGKAKMRRPREKALFRGTARYCSIATHEKFEQGRSDDLWSLIYLMAELRGPLPWHSIREKKDILEIKKRTEHDVLMENSPVELVQIAQHLSTLTYYTRPDYVLIYNLLRQVMENGRFKFTDPWDWARGGGSLEKAEPSGPSLLSKERFSKENPLLRSREWAMSAEPLQKEGGGPFTPDELTYFPTETFSTNPHGF